MFVVVFPMGPQNIEFYHFVIIGILFLSTYIFVSKIKNKFKNVLYYREIPDNLHPAIIQYYSNGYLNDKSFWLILLELIQKGYYKFERFKVNDQIDYKIKWMKDNYYDLTSFKLHDYEKLVIKYINTYILSHDRKHNQKTKTILLSILHEQIKADINLKGFIEKIHSSIRYEIKHSYGFINTEVNVLLAAILVFGYYIILFPGLSNVMSGTLYTLIIMIIANVLKNTKFNLKGMFGILLLIYTILVIFTPLLPSLMFAKNPMMIILIYFNPFLIFLASYVLSTNIYTHKQSELMKKIIGSKMFLKDFTLLKYRPVDYINFVKYYYVLAEAYGIKITDQDYVKTFYDDDTFDTMSADDFAEVIFDDILGGLFSVSKERQDYPYI